MKHNNRVSAVLREAEKEVDNTYLSNPLVSRPFAQAAWCFLAFCEEWFIREFVQATRAGTPPPAFEEASIADAVMGHAKWPLQWLLTSCEPGGMPPSKLDSKMYEASWRLSELALDYLWFEVAFTYASLGLLNLSLEDQRIVPSESMKPDAQFEVYDRLIDLNEGERLLYEVTPLMDQVRNSVRVSGHWFSYELNPRLIKEGLRLAGPFLENRFRLPADWALPRYTIGEFSRVAKSLWVLAFIHFSARVAAAINGCLDLGYSRALMLLGKVELQQRLARYSGVEDQPLGAIIEDLTYGARGINKPDPALQPLISLTSTVFGVAPNLILSNSLERNLIVLANRLPNERHTYTKLSIHRESLLRRKIFEALSGLGWRFWNGTISNWEGKPDIDLAIISDEERRCILLELKSFLAPAEPREIWERSLEIEKGIDQVRTRRGLTESQPQPLCEALGIEKDYLLSWAVVSETSVGGVWVQAGDIPVVRSSHLVRKLAVARNLAEPSAWLAERRYLPREGQHFRVADREVTVGSWTLEWYKVEVVVDDFV